MPWPLVPAAAVIIKTGYSPFSANLLELLKLQYWWIGFCKYYTTNTYCHRRMMIPWKYHSFIALALLLVLRTRNNMQLQWTCDIFRYRHSTMVILFPTLAILLSLKDDTNHWGGRAFTRSGELQRLENWGRWLDRERSGLSLIHQPPNPTLLILNFVQRVQSILCTLYILTCILQLTIIQYFVVCTVWVGK